eukprot:CAMPEP_0184648204 /NCGR_PEP_ID=MMETSP0308-20130426/5275_1 /TAXON_ID=38269 /ORGANISM="Gloeochaete witrockiana, Strain SAG 46.84" /LENGTH=179 /DNA_ID=CAMNT_0027079845 /DNA_START=163 /DNA_END=699 /DNA_ORIENTATION=-
MFGLFYGLWEYFTKKIEFQILILGLDDAGKTTLLEKTRTIFTKIEGLPPEKIAPTVGLNIGRMVVGNALLILWDLGGQKGLRGIWDKYFSETHALLFVVDSAGFDRLDEAKATLDQILMDSKLSRVPLLFFANKQDLPSAKSAHELAAFFELETIKDRPCRVQAVCALTGRGIKEGFQW